MNQQHPGDVQIRDNPDRARFEISVNGELVGYAEYRHRPGRIVFTHTEIDDAHRGQGLAGRLVHHALDTARVENLQITPLCPYIADYIRHHPDYLDLVDDRHRGNLTAS